jgi:RNA recognition motif-containing protein
MATRLYVGGLSYGTTEQSLREAFEQIGEVVSAVIIIDRMTNRSKGFGFVEMADDSAAQTAIEKFNGNELDGRRVTVNEARPMEDRPKRPFRSNDRGGDRGGFRPRNEY